MAKPIVMPQVGQDLEEGKLVEWRVKLGDTIKKGDIVAVVESEKASFEVEAYEAGRVVTLVYDEGATTKVLSPLLFVEAEGEAAAPAPSAASPEVGASSASTDAAAVAESEAGVPEAAAPASSAPAPAPAGAVDVAAVAESDVAGAAGSAVRAGRSSPLARRAAGAAGLDLGGLKGSGPRGAVVMRDVQKALEARGGAAPARAEAPRAAPAPAPVPMPAAPAPMPAVPPPTPPRAAPAPAPARTGVPGALNRAWLRKGEGDPIVMVHGFGADLNAWRVLAGAADLRRPILAVDLPGHGASPDGGGSLADLAAAVAAALEEEGVTAADLVGHSLGAAVAVAVAETARFTVRSLFLLSPAGLGPDINGDFLDGFTRARSEAALGPWMRLLVADEAAVGPALVRVTAEARARPGVAEAQERIAGALFPDGTQSFDVRRALGALPVPVRVVFGAADRIVPARHCAALPGTVAVHTLPGVGHMPFLEARETVARILAEHLRSAA